MAFADDWPFDDPPNVAVVTTANVLDGRLPILQVVHDEDDGGWQFLPSGGAPDASADLRLIALDEVLKLDSTVVALADLPYGWLAWRPAVGSAWRRQLIVDRPSRRPPGR